MRKFESSQKDESRAQSADSSKAYRKPRAFICLPQYHFTIFLHFANRNLKKILIFGKAQRAACKGSQGRNLAIPVLYYRVVWVSLQIKQNKSEQMSATWMALPCHH